MVELVLTSLKLGQNKVLQVPSCSIAEMDEMKCHERDVLNIREMGNVLVLPLSRFPDFLILI